MIRTFRPSAPLREFVRYYYVLTCRERVNTLTFPLGYPQIIFHKGTPLFIAEMGSSQSRFTVSGQVNFPAHVVSDGNTEMIVVVFRPHTMGMFIGTPPSEFYNTEIPGDELGNDDLSRLASEIFDSPDIGLCIGMIERWMLSRLRHITATRHTDRIGHAIESIMVNPSMTVGMMAETACLGTKQFSRVFDTLVGMMPKEYARIVRFQKSMHMLRSRACGLADIAYACGYSDQSHFIREFRQYSGTTPTHIDNPYSDLFGMPT